jgi:Secretion system C-terminal sorting domain
LLKKLLTHMLPAALFILFAESLYGQWIEWEKRPVHDNFEIRSFSVKLTSGGSMIISGYRNGGGFVFKANGNGDSVWTCSNARGYTLTEDKSGNVYSAYENFIYKISSNGTLIWQKNLNGTSYTEVAISKLITSTDNCLIAGGTALHNGFWCSYIIKIDINGNGIWSHSASEAGKSFSISNLSEQSNGTILAIGNVSASGSYQNFIAGYKSGGRLMFHKIFGDNNNYLKTGKAVFRLSNNGYLAFTGLLFASGNSRLSITGLDSSGNVEWNKLHPSSNGIYAVWPGEGIIKDRFKNQYLVAGSKPYYNYPYDTNFCSLASYDSLGNLIWEKLTYSDSFPAFFNGIAQNNDSSYIICGDAFRNFSTGSLANPKYLYLLKTKKINPIGITSINSAVPLGFNLYQNYPNPFNPSTKIRFDLPQAEKFSLEVFDILGRKIYNMIDSRPPGSYELELDASSFPSGVYFYRLTSGSFRASRRMMLVK